MPVMIFQEPMTNLNPCFTVGFQILEALKVYEGSHPPAADPRLRVPYAPHPRHGRVRPATTRFAEI